MAWSLSAVEGLDGNLTTLSYIQSTQNVGDGDQSQFFTQQTHLYRVQQKSGNRLILRYCPRAQGNTSQISKGENLSNKKKSEGLSQKSGSNRKEQASKISASDTCTPTETSFVEFVDPWQINAEPDGYQERYSSLYLGAVDYQANPKTTVLSQPSSRILLQTEFLAPNDSAELAKRVLTEIFEQAYDKELEKVVDMSPPTLYSYWGQNSADGVSIEIDDTSKIYNSSNGALYGSLKSVVSSEGGTRTYTYEQVSLEVIRHNVIKDFYGFKHKWPLFGNNYVVIVGTGKDGQDRVGLRISVYTWTTHGWIQKTLYEDLEVSLPYAYNPFRQVALQENYIALIHPNFSSISISHLNQVNQSWSDPVQLKATYSPSSLISLAGGSDFLLVSAPVLGPVNVDAGNQLTEAKFELHETPDQGRTWSTVTSGNLVDSNTFPINASSFRTVGVGVGSNIAVVAMAQPNVPGSQLSAKTYILTVGLMFRDFDGQWKTKIDTHNEIPNPISNYSPKGKRFGWGSIFSGGYVSADVNQQNIDIQQSGSLLGVAINNYPNQYGYASEAHFHDQKHVPRLGSQSISLPVSSFSIKAEGPELSLMEEYYTNYKFLDGRTPNPLAFTYSLPNINLVTRDGHSGLDGAAGMSFSASGFASAQAGFYEHGLDVRLKDRPWYCGHCKCSMLFRSI